MPGYKGGVFCKAYSWLVIYDIVLGVVSYYGSMGTNSITFPTDYIIFAVARGKSVTVKMECKSDISKLIGKAMNLESMIKD